ncbi:MAG: hypothetical protein ACFFC7_06695 [Candidatus Hermodarchaeota archaeon]
MNPVIGFLMASSTSTSQSLDAQISNSNDDIFLSNSDIYPAQKHWQGYLSTQFITFPQIKVTKQEIR